MYTKVKSIKKGLRRGVDRPGEDFEVWFGKGFRDLNKICKNHNSVGYVAIFFCTFYKNVTNYINISLWSDVGRDFDESL